MDTPRQSGIGTASCITSVLSCGLILLIQLRYFEIPDGLREASPYFIFLLMAMFALCGLSVLALGMGIGALTQKDRSKTSAMIGVAISSLTLGGAFLFFPFFGG